MRSGSVLEAPLPARWTRGQRWKNTLIFWCIRALVAMVRPIPFRVICPLFQVLGWLAAWVDRPDRRRAEAHLAQAFPELGPAVHRRLTRRMFVHLATSAAEALHINRFLSGPHAVALGPECHRVFADALAEGRGAIAVTGHLGNWELLAQVVATAGFPVHTIAKPLYDPRLTRWVDALRGQHGLQTIWRGERGTSRDMLRVFRQQEMLALLIDQDTKVQGAFVPFFGRLAHTPTAAAALALRLQTPVVLCWIRRQGSQHRVFVERVSVPVENTPETVRQLTATLTARLEAAIRQAPEQWVWLHRRWKQAPPTSADQFSASAGAAGQLSTNT